MANPSTLTPQQIAQLAQLKDIHLPEAVSWWPLAAGWWLLLALLLTVVIALFVWQAKQRHSGKRAALHCLAQLSADTPTAFAAELSALLRRVAIQHVGQSAATLSGDDWSAFLCKDQLMPEKMAYYLAHAPYAPLASPFSDSELRRAAEQWIRRLS